MLGLGFTVLAVVATAFASPHAARWDDLKVKHTWKSAPANWVSEGPAPEGATIDLRIALKPHQEDALVKALYEVSDPEHGRYGLHLSKGDVASLVAPHPDTQTLVSAWLSHHEIPASSISSTEAGDWLVVSAVPVPKADALLGADYQVYRHATTNDTVLRTIGYSLPSVLHGHIDVVAPTTYFSSTRSMRTTSSKDPNGKIVQDDSITRAEIAQLLKKGQFATVPSSCKQTITPSCLRALYNSTSYVPKATDKNKLGVTGYLDIYANFADLQTFYKQLLPNAVGNNFTVVEVHGGLNDQSQPGAEANLDIQYASSISFPTPNIFYSTGGSPPFNPDSSTPTNTNEPYLDWLDFIAAQDTIPQTITTSYGDDEQTVPPDYAQTVCSRFAQLGARGVSVLFSSGDSGVGGGSCTTNDGTNRTQFVPNFPASCPFVTAVGGTTSVGPEVAAALSSGGFSNYFARPSYQADAVQTFLGTLGNKYAGLYNTTGRGFPDVSAQAIGFEIVIDGFETLERGTSCSSPTFAAIVSLLNDFRISEGKAPLGFLNPLLYSKGVAGLNDITSGSNPGCGTAGFSAVKGWDPVTGLGSPDFGKLQTIVSAA
ncbi:subtilisin-like protein [Dentipellis sp. KUC8613]|nr:subtilisin-like protein [Dentipellis sp. KUC8613]